jgi:LysR family glycine cleavage system transcriptional activator
MRAFEATARHLSFTRAAEALSVTQGALSRHVSGLEHWLGVKLFKRGRHGIELTPEGDVYFRLIRNALDQIETGTRQLQMRPGEERLRLKLPPTFAIRWLVPRLARFQALNPQLDVQITTSHHRADFAREEVDVAIHSESEPPASPGYRKLFGEVLLPVCSPGLIERGLPLSKPADLAQHPLLSSLNRPLDWPTWLAAAKLRAVDANTGLKFEDAALAYQAAADSLGVMIAQEALVADDLRAGRLVAPLQPHVPTGGGYYLQFRTDQPKPKRVALFEEWVIEEANKPAH